MSIRKQFRLSAEQLEDRLAPVGALDAAFSEDGLRTIDLNAIDTGRGVAVQTDGKIVVAGSTDGGSSDFVIARFDPDGTLDDNFNGVFPLGGTQTIGFGFGVLAGADIATAVAIQPDGKIVVAGYTSFLGSPGDENDFAVIRLNPNGELDDTFGENGRRRIDFNGDARANAVAIDNLGRIVVAGSVNGDDFAVARLEANGDTDQFFNGPFGGTQTVGFGGGILEGADIAAGVAIQSDGSIVVAGYTSFLGVPGNENNIAVIRLTSLGELDDTFNGDGRRTIDLGADDRGGAVAVQSDGKIVVVGSTDDGTNSDFAIARLVSDGTLDQDFNGPFPLGGTQTVSFNSGIFFNGNDFATGVAIQTDGKIIVTGFTDLFGSLTNPNDFAIARLTASGQPDGTFDADGQQRVDLGANDRSNGVALQADGRIVVVGTRAVPIVGTSDIAVVRVEGEASGLSITVDNGVASVTAGGTVTYTIVVTNSGPDTVVGAQVLDAFPATLTGVSYTSTATGGATGNSSGSGNIADSLNLPAGASVTYTVTATLAAGATGTLSNTASVTPPVGVFEMNSADNIATDTDPISVVADVGVTKTNGVASVTAGGVTTYTVVVTNSGPSTATGVTVSDVFPATLTGVSYTSTAAGGATGNTSGSGNIADTLTLPPGASVTYMVTGTVSATVTGTLSNTVTASVGGGVSDPVVGNNTATDTDTIIATVPPMPPVPTGKPFAVGAGMGGSPLVNVYNPDGSAKGTTTAFADGFAGGVRVAAADLTGDGVPDTIVGTGPGGVTSVRVLDGATGAEGFAVQPFESAFTGGVYVAAGDLTGDGTPDIVITPDEGGGPRVLVYDGQSFQLVRNFFGIDDPNFRGGARASVGDLNADGRSDLVVAAGFGGGPRVAFYDGTTVTGGQSPTRLLGDRFVFEQTLRNGVFVAAGDVDGDGSADLIAGGGPGGGPRVLALSGKDLLAGVETPLANFFVGNPDNRGGVRVAAKDLDGDTRADLVVGDGDGAGSRVTGYLGKNVTPSAAPSEQFSFDAFPGFTGGVYVG